jgi:hypothetical protein
MGKVRYGDGRQVPLRNRRDKSHTRGPISITNAAASPSRRWRLSALIAARCKAATEKAASNAGQAGTSPVPAKARTWVREVPLTGRTSASDRLTPWEEAPGERHPLARSHSRYARLPVPGLRSPCAREK